MMEIVRRIVCFCIGCLIFAQLGFAQSVTDELAAYNEPPSRLRGVIEKYTEDFGGLNRFYTAQTSANRFERFKQLYADEQALLNKLNFDTLNHDEQIDYLLFKNYLDREQKELNRFNLQFEEMSSIIPFAKTISDLEDTRRKLESIDPAKTAALLNNLVKQINATQKSLEDSTTKPKRTVANRAVRMIASLRPTLRNWYNFHNAYDPVFSWWNAEPYKSVEDSLQRY